MAKKKSPSKESSAPRRKRRDVQQMIADLEAKIAVIREREAQRRAKADPVLRHVKSALRNLDQAVEAAEDRQLAAKLEDARGLLNGLFSEGSEGTATHAPRRGRRGAGAGAELSEALLAYVRANPGQRGEQIAAALGTDSSSMRPTMKRLIAEGKIETEGQRRGMTYTAR